MIKKEKNIMLYIEDILESVDKIEEYIGEIKEEDFYRNTQLQDSILRRLEIIGEAAKNIPMDFRNKYSIIPWKRMAGMRDVLIHEYFGVNLKRVWRAVKKDLPRLKKEILNIIETEAGKANRAER